jgi:hypothetical protein
MTGNVQREYAVTLTGSEGDLAAFEAAIDRVEEGGMLGAPGFGCAALLFTVFASDAEHALEAAIVHLRSVGLVIPNGASLSVLEHEPEALSA